MQGGPHPHTGATDGAAGTSLAPLAARSAEKRAPDAACVGPRGEKIEPHPSGGGGHQEPRAAANTGPRAAFPASSRRAPSALSTAAVAAVAAAAAAAAAAGERGAAPAPLQGSVTPARSSSRFSETSRFHDSWFQTPRSAQSLDQLDMLLEVEEADTPSRMFRAFRRLCEEQESRGRADIVLEQVLLVRCILDAEFDERLRRLPASEANLLRLEREAVEAVQRLVEERVWGLQRVVRRSICAPAAAERRLSSPSGRASVASDASGACLGLPRESLRPSRGASLAAASLNAARAERDYAVPCASAGGEAWLNASGRVGRLGENGRSGTPASRFMPARGPSLWGSTPLSMEPRCEAHHPLPPERLGKTKSAVQCAGFADFTPFLLFVPVGVGVRCLRALQQLPGAAKLVVCFTVGGARRTVEGFTRLVHRIHSLQLTNLSFLFVVGATVRCCRGACRVAVFQLCLTLGGAWRAVAASQSAAAHAMIAARAAISDALAAAVGWGYEGLVLLPLGCGVKLTGAAAKGVRRVAATAPSTISLPRRCGMYSVCLALGIGAKATARISALVPASVCDRMKCV
ncbi:uncharacterized protein Tco025E_01468 [Trypanosoma conorhini]|uniref:Uncharacterized protein n=1 Tax=Trypanosoma conorhini TaxID=83891 RepID=A0A422Q8E7_9TRYP|nr:uncharacterized protein Tco025E_01468 [Trypanosoma conorhini]RNF26252.1 hypothetical protein Tco025E_01468 [Trypanosoma conorhini]